MSTVKLSPVLKQLLSQRHPQPFASPPKQLLNSVLERTRAEAKQHGALNGWLVLSVIFISFQLIELASHSLMSPSPTPYQVPS